MQKGLGATVLCSRRQVLTGAAIAGGWWSGRPRPGAAQPATPSASPAAAGWTYTDLLGTTVTLPAPPRRIAAAINIAAALDSFGVSVPTVFGWTASNHPDGDHVAWGDLDPAAVAIVSNAEGNVELEPLVVETPDLIVTWVWDKANPVAAHVGLPELLLPDLNRIAPVIVVNQGDANDIELARLEAFVASLGIDLAAPAITAAQADYQAKLTELEAVAAAKPDLSVLFGSYGDDQLFIASPDYVGDLGLLRTHGLALANDGSPTATTYWETLSQEAALHYPSDVIYIDQYGAIKTLVELRAHPTMGQHPAVLAGQGGPWSRDLPLSYTGQTMLLEEILVPLRNAGKVT